MAAVCVEAYWDVRSNGFPELEITLKKGSNHPCSGVKPMGKTKKLKVTPILETGITLEFSPEKAPVPKTCHLTLRWAMEKCPICGSTLMIYYCPTIKHESGIGAVLHEEKHKIVVSCVSCNFLISEGFSTRLKPSDSEDRKMIV